MIAFLGYGLVAVAVFTIDFILKNHIEKTKEVGECTSICHDKLLIRRYHNRGAFLDIMENRSGIVAFVSLTLTLFATVVFIVTFGYRGSSMLKLGLAFLLGGAYSNTYDRLRRKYVVDYVSFPVKNRRIRNIVFNISDFAIMTGALLIVLAQSKK